MIMRRLLVPLAVLLAIAGCALPGPARPHTTLGAQASPLRTDFNDDEGKVRLVLLVSPTCGTCLRGAADIQQRVLAVQHDRRLRAYVVWVPKRGAREGNVAEATPTVPDERARHYWDSTGYLVHAYNRVLNLGQDAWDVYLLYGPQTRWDATDPPVPSFWMDQLGIHQFDTTTFNKHLAAQLPGSNP